MNSNPYWKINADGSTEGVHPDTLEAHEFPNRDKGFKAIRAKCIDCAGNSVEVRKCPCYKCPLWAFRLGRSPKALKSQQGKHLKKWS